MVILARRIKDKQGIDNRKKKKGEMDKLNLKCVIFGLNARPMGSSVVRLPWEHRTKVKSAIFPTQTLCKHSHLKLQIRLEE